MPTEIFRANLLVQTDKGPKWVKDVVYKHTDGYFHRKRYFKEPVKVLQVEIIKSLGFSFEGLTHIEVKKSEETRNTTTGAYE
jgi:hypothetical protein